MAGQPPAGYATGRHTTIRIFLAPMRDIFLSRAALHQETLALCWQGLRNFDRVFRVILSRVWPSRHDALAIVKPATLAGGCRVVKKLGRAVGAILSLSESAAELYPKVGDGMR